MHVAAAGGSGEESFLYGQSHCRPALVVVVVHGGVVVLPLLAVHGPAAERPPGGVVRQRLGVPVHPVQVLLRDVINSPEAGTVLRGAGAGQVSAVGGGTQRIAEAALLLT